MKHSLIVVDDFHPEPHALRAAVVASEFKTEIGPDGAPYTGISRHEDKTVFEKIAEVMQCPIRPQIAVWRASYQGEVPNTVVHADDICAQWAGVLYLNTPEQCAANFSGTGFFTHRATGLDRMPGDEALASIGVDAARFKSKMEQDWQEPDAWDIAGFVGMKFNRFVAYPTSRFHNRHPLEAFGATPADGRLILACFFDLAP